MDPRLFRADLEAKPDRLGRLADRLDQANPWEGLDDPSPKLLLIGMGSSAYTASVAAARLRVAGVHAVAELASSDLLPEPNPRTVVVAISAGGGSRETAAAVDLYAGRCPVALLTNTPDSPLAQRASTVVDLSAGTEQGGVACRSFQHTTALLLALEERLTGADLGVAELVRASAEASADLLARRTDWLPDVSRLLLGPDGTHLAAPAHRLSSAWQGALMLREGPRRPAVGSETGDWSHVDVYLTKTTDYRLLLFPGSRWEDELLRWCGERGSTVVAVGDTVPEAALSLRYAGDDRDDVRLLTEVLVPELVAAEAWAAG